MKKHEDEWAKDKPFHNLTKQKPDTTMLNKQQHAMTAETKQRQVAATLIINYIVLRCLSRLFPDI